MYILKNKVAMIKKLCFLISLGLVLHASENAAKKRRNTSNHRSHKRAKTTDTEETAPAAKSENITPFQQTPFMIKELRALIAQYLSNDYGVASETALQDHSNMTVSPDGKYIAFATQSPINSTFSNIPFNHNHLSILDRTTKTYKSLITNNKIQKLAFSRNSQLLAVVFFWNYIKIYNLELQEIPFQTNKFYEWLKTTSNIINLTFSDPQELVLVTEDARLITIDQITKTNEKKEDNEKKPDSQHLMQPLGANYPISSCTFVTSNEQTKFLTSNAGSISLINNTAIKPEAHYVCNDNPKMKAYWRYGSIVIPGFDSFIHATQLNNKRIAIGGSKNEYFKFIIYDGTATDAVLYSFVTDQILSLIRLDNENLIVITKNKIIEIQNLAGFINQNLFLK